MKYYPNEPIFRSVIIAENKHITDEIDRELADIESNFKYRSMIHINASYTCEEQLRKEQLLLIKI